MKELEKTKRISISAVLFLLVTVIALLTFKKPKHVFDKTSGETLKEIVSNNYILTLDEFNSNNSEEFVLIDNRSNFEYTKGHFDDAINIPPHQMLEESNIDFFNELENSNKTAVLYGKNPEEVNGSWMLLYQLGYNNVKILSIETKYVDNQFETKSYVIEKPSVNYAQIMLKEKLLAENSKTQKSEKVVAKPAPPKKVVTIKKKKKRVPEGGC